VLGITAVAFVILVERRWHENGDRSQLPQAINRIANNRSHGLMRLREQPWALRFFLTNAFR